MEPREEKLIENRDDPSGQGYNERINTLKEKLDRPIWHQMFLSCCVVAASLDPLFFYIPIINDQKKCLGMDEKLKKTALVLRSVMDLTYICHIAFQIFYGYVRFLAYASESGVTLCVVHRICWNLDWIKGVIGRIKWWIIIIDILCILPIPQVVILVYFSKMKGLESLNWRKFLNFVLLFQFVPRILRIYHSCKVLTKNLIPRKIVGASWVTGLFNFFLYIIASHLFGAFWYFFSVQRELACWQLACKGNSMCNQSNFFCKHGYDIVNDPIVAYLNLSCSLIPPSRFDFGMSTPALQSKIVNSMDFLRKFFYCFAWGLRTLSSFGSNLQTSTNFWESLFSAAITIIGLLLFIYLIGNLQTYLQFSAKASEKRTRKMEKKEAEIDTWIKSNEIPPNMGKELKNRVCKKMDENDDVNLTNLVNVLPTQSKKRIKQRMCLPILKKVALLNKMDDKLIEKIFINHLKPVVFNKSSKIFKEGDPLEQMLFFTQGSASVYSRGTTPSKLRRGDFYGAELLEWGFEARSSQAPSSDAPSSQARSSQAPLSQAPSSQAPASQAPPSQARSSQAPPSQARSSQAPPSQAPSPQIPSSQAPSSKAPSSQAPPSQARASQAPSSQALSSKAPSSQAPLSQATSSQAPPSQAPLSQAPSSPFPNSHKTVKATTKVEAFALEHGVMKEIADALQKNQPQDIKKMPNYRRFIKRQPSNSTDVSKRRWGLGPCTGGFEEDV